MRISWLREREISMTMMSMYIISSWGEHLQEAEEIIYMLIIVMLISLSLNQLILTLL